MPEVVSRDGSSLSLWCPGCEGVHLVSIGEGGWTWDGNREAPTISPSILVTGVQWAADKPFHKRLHPVPAGQETRCHSFVVRGQWQYLTDSTHALAGQTVDMVTEPAEG